MVMNWQVLQQSLVFAAQNVLQVAVDKGPKIYNRLD
jgi:hypothetical protein